MKRLFYCLASLLFLSLSAPAPALAEKPEKAAGEFYKQQMEQDKEFRKKALESGREERKQWLEQEREQRKQWQEMEREQRKQWQEQYKEEMEKGGYKRERDDD
jgi:flagellar motor protein MotB